MSTNKKKTSQKEVEEEAFAMAAIVTPLDNAVQRSSGEKRREIVSKQITTTGQRCGGGEETTSSQYRQPLMDWLRSSWVDILPPKALDSIFSPFYCCAMASNSFVINNIENCVYLMMMMIDAGAANRSMTTTASWMLLKLKRVPLTYYSTHILKIWNEKEITI